MRRPFHVSEPDRNQLFAVRKHVHASMCRQIRRRNVWIDAFGKGFVNYCLLLRAERQQDNRFAGQDCRNSHRYGARRSSLETAEGSGQSLSAPIFEERAMRVTKLWLGRFIECDVTVATYAQYRQV